METKGKDCKNLKDEIAKLIIELERCQDELKLRNKYNGGSKNWMKC